MKLKLILITFALTVFSYVYADDHIEITGMEAIQCKFEEGKDMDDVMKVISEYKN